MRKTVLLFLLGSLFANFFANGQNAVADALRLQSLATYDDEFKAWTLKDTSEVFHILAKYDPDLQGTSGASYSDVLAKYNASNNPFICATCPITVLPPGFSISSFNAGGGGLFSKIGGLDVTNLADGLAQFLVKRTKEELNTAFFSRFKEALDKHEEFQKLFPNTYAVFQLIGEQVYQINTYLDAIRSAYIQDFKSLPGHLSDYLREANHKDIFKKKWMKYLVPDLLTAAQMGIDGTSPVTIINYLADNLPFDSAGVVGLEGGVKTAQLLSNLLQSGDPTRIYVSQSQINQLLLKQPAFDIFLAFMYQMDGGNIEYVTKDTTISLREALRNKDLQLGLQLKQHVYNLVSYGKSLDDDFRSLATDTSLTKNNRYQTFYNAMNTIIEIINEGFEIRMTLTGQPVSAEEQKVIRVLQLLNEIYLDVRLNNFSSVIVKLTELLELLLQDSHFEYKDALLKFGSFMAAMAQADSSNEVADIIEAYALPAGSSTMKKYSRFNMSINSYVGLFGGKEELRDVEGNPTEWTGSLSAPLGFAASWGLDGKGAISLYGSLIDIGALTAFRFNDTTTVDIPKIKLKNIYAPGVFLVYGLPKNIPVSIGAGMQVNPGLREVNTAGNTIESSTIRYGIFISVDIPLWNLVNIPRSD